MPFFQEIFLWYGQEQVGQKTLTFSGNLLQNLSESVSAKICSRDITEMESCRDESAAFLLKMAAIATILVAGVAGVTLPLVGRNFRFLRTDSNVFLAAKAFAAGVILATGFVHMLPDATSALTDVCLPKYPWRKFPFSGFIAMMASLGTLLVEFMGTQYYERKHEKQSRAVRVDSDSETGSLLDGKDSGENVCGEEDGGSIHIVGMHAHVAHHRHSHEPGTMPNLHSHSHSHSHLHGFSGGDGENGLRHAVVSQVLELGILSHSIIIGLSLGVSQSPCTIRPLMGALSFHQFFEGFALGGCISQAQFSSLHASIMACFFAITTPIGIAIGTGISSIYNPNSPRALVIEGTLDSISAGILVYMALVDLIAADFLSKRMKCDVRLQIVSYFTLFLGAGLMSSLAMWA